MPSRRPHLRRRGFEVGDALVAICGIVGSGADRRRRLAADRQILSHAHVSRLRATIDDLWNDASRGVHDHFSRLEDCHNNFCNLDMLLPMATKPIALARAMIFRARCTTGGSIIFEPRLTTPRPFSCASL